MSLLDRRVSCDLGVTPGRTQVFLGSPLQFRPLSPVRKKARQNMFFPLIVIETPSSDAKSPSPAPAP